MDIVISPSNKPQKKFQAVIDGRKTIHFGQAGASDFTKHNDTERKQRYIDRHKKRENWQDPTTAGFFAKHVLWNKPTLTESIKDLDNRYKSLNIKYKK